jgi:hypothetical protein
MSKVLEFERANRTRQYLRSAGITRPKLTENTATTMHVGFRSWRDTSITWLALAGIDTAKIQRRAGHDEISTTIGYIKAAEDLSGALGEPFQPLPAALLEPSDGPPDAPTTTDLRAKDWAKSEVENSKLLESYNNYASPAGFENGRGTVIGKESTVIDRNERVDCDLNVQIATPLGPNAGGAPGTVEEALRLALVLAVGVGEYERAGEVLDLLRRERNGASVSTLHGVRARGR